MQSRKPSQDPIRFGFLLVPNYSMIAFSSAIEPLRMANRLSNKNLYQWVTISCDGRPVTASNGLQLQPDCAIADIGPLSAVFVCSGVDVHLAYDQTLLFWLRKLAHRKLTIGALCTGSYILAKAHLLDGYRCTIHWENIASIREEFPNIVVSPDLFELDRDRYTCAGGIASLDMMLHLISQQQDATLAADISEQFLCERIRDHHDRQRIPLRAHIGTSQPKLLQAVSLMESNLEEPMSLDELAQHVGISRRQLERSFQKYLQCVPTRYYLELRLAHARRLLLQTSMSIVDVALACGFVSAPHFSKCYRDFFGVPPRDERRLRSSSSREAHR